MKQLQQKINSALAQHPCRAAFVIRNLKTGEKLEQNPHMVFPAASTIKVPIMIEIMRQAAAGKISLDKTLTVTSDVKTGGSGILTELRTGLTMTIRELVTLMIILSDNTATNMLIDLIGMDCVNNTMAGLGVKSTLLQRKMMDFAAAKTGRENLTTAADLAFLFTGIANNTLGLPAEYNDLMLDILKRQQIRDKIPFYLPEKVVVANKTGNLSKEENAAAILNVPSGPYVISVLTDGLRKNYEGLQLVANIGKIIYDYAS